MTRKRSGRLMAFARCFFAALIVALLFAGSFSGTVRADTAPKRSITIEISNPPDEPYYFALLEKTSYKADINYHYDHVREEDAWIRELFYNYDEDGYRLFIYAGSTNSIRSSEDQMHDGIVKYNYMVPSTFKVIVITRKGEVTVSDPVTVKAFHSECTYDFKSNTIKEVYKPDFDVTYFIEIIIYLSITVEIEGFLLFAFRLFNKKNLKRFIFINLVTQGLLMAFNTVSRLVFVVMLNHFQIWLCMEVVITAIEMIYYSKRLVNKQGKVSVKRNLIYGFVANLVSAFIDLPIVLIMMFLKNTM